MLERLDGFDRCDAMAGHFRKIQVEERERKGAGGVEMMKPGAGNLSNALGLTVPWKTRTQSPYIIAGSKHATFRLSF